jgi:hypothetical protein
MAILSSFPGLTVEILVNGIAREEYQPPEDEVQDTQKHVTRYIEAESGANFEVRVSLNSAFKTAFDISKYDLCAVIRIDGSYAESRLWHMSDLRSLTLIDQSKKISGVSVGSGKDWKLRKFLFSNLTCNDDSMQSVDQQLKKRIKKLGEITVGFKRVHILAEETNPVQPDPIEKYSNFSIPEKVLKGRAISTKAG